jgi:hypothetical protein
MMKKIFLALTLVLPACALQGAADNGKEVLRRRDEERRRKEDDINQLWDYRNAEKRGNHKQALRILANFNPTQQEALRRDREKKEKIEKDEADKYFWLCGCCKWKIKED